MHMAFLMGIDLGTSSLKTIVTDETGHIAAESSKSYQFSSPRVGYAEQDPQEWWEACCMTVRACIERLGMAGYCGRTVSASDIKGISFSGQMHGAVMLDAGRNCIRPAILHCDARSAAQVEEINQILGPERVRGLVMNPVYTGFLLPSLLWVRENEPENYEKIKYVMLPKDYIKFRMTGEISSDISDASATLAFDIKNVCWSDEILGLTGVSRDIFPACYGTAEAIGTVSAAAARETGLCAGTVVAAGGGDHLMQGIGSGVINEGQASSNIGTSGQVSFRSRVPVLNPALSTNTFCSYEKGRWLTMGAMMSAGLSLKWFNSLFETADYDLINAQAAEVGPGSGGVLFLPYLNGERTPHVDPNLSGMFMGVNLNTGRAQLTRAVMEGVAFALNQCIEVCSDLGLSAKTMVASGGGARSPVWLKIQADIFDRPLMVTDTEEQAGLGAAITAGVAAGIFSSVEEGCAACVRYRDTVIVPDQASHRIYEEYYGLYKDTYTACKDVLQSITLMGRRQ